MRSRVRAYSEWFRPVPWLVDGECDGCYFHGNGRDADCLNQTSTGNFCDDKGEFAGHVFIQTGKEAYEAYIHTAVLLRLDGHKPLTDE